MKTAIDNCDFLQTFLIEQYTYYSVPNMNENII